MSEQPIPCPFCGCDARSDDPMLRDAGYGVCRTANCPAYTRTAFAPEIWNRRSPPAPAIDVEAVARQAVKELWDDVTDRSGIKHQFNMCDTEARKEIRAAWFKIIRAALTKNTDAQR